MKNKKPAKKKESRKMKSEREINRRVNEKLYGPAEGDYPNDEIFNRL